MRVFTTIFFLLRLWCDSMGSVLRLTFLSFASICCFAYTVWMSWWNWCRWRWSKCENWRKKNLAMQEKIIELERFNHIWYDRAEKYSLRPSMLHLDFVVIFCHITLTLSLDAVAIYGALHNLMRRRKKPSRHFCDWAITISLFSVSTELVL